MNIFKSEFKVSVSLCKIISLIGLIIVLGACNKKNKDNKNLLSDSKTDSITTIFLDKISFPEAQLKKDLDLTDIKFIGNSDILFIDLPKYKRNSYILETDTMKSIGYVCWITGKNVKNHKIKLRINLFVNLKFNNNAWTIDKCGIREITALTFVRQLLYVLGRILYFISCLLFIFVVYYQIITLFISDSKIPGCMYNVPLVILGCIFFFFIVIIFYFVFDIAGAIISFFSVLILVFLITKFLSSN